MGSLTPGASYIYENTDGIIYAREPGSTYRREIGRTLEKTDFDNELAEEILLRDIIRQSKKNPALQKALDHVKIIYYLNKDNP